MWLPLLCLLCLIAFATFLWQGNHWRRRGMKGPFGWPLVGNMLDFALARRSYGQVCEEIYSQNPGLKYVAFYRLFNEPAILVRDQELLRHILVGSHFVDCAENAVHVDPRRDVLASHNPFIASGDPWRIFRADLVALFTPSRLRQTLPHVVSACQLLRAQIPLKLEGFEAKDLATRYTLQVVASVVFGLDAHCLDREEECPNRWLQWLAPLFQPSSKWSWLETVSLLHSPRLGWIIGHRYVPLQMQRWFRDLVAGRSGGDNLLQWLAESKRTLTKDELAGHATTLLLEGYETSAMLLAFVLYELARNEEVQRRLHQELDEVAQRHDGQLMDTAALSQLRYAEAALLEALRLHPAMQALQKRCTKSFRLPAQKSGCESETESALQVDVGTVLVLPVQAIHLDPDMWPEPKQFRPERFLQQPQMGCRFLGFGAGARMCPGMRLGLLQTKAALATLLQDHSVLLAERNQDQDQDQVEVEVSPLTFLTASKRGIWLRLERRSTQ